MKKRAICCFTLVLMLLLAGCTTPQKEKDRNLRLVTASPELAEIISALGAVDNIVGISAECNYPPQLQNKSLIGTFGKIDTEKVVELQPDIVFAAGNEQDYLATELRKLGIRVEKIFPGSIADLPAVIDTIGVLIKREKEADKLITELREKIKQLRNSRPLHNPTLYIEIYGNPIMSVSDSSYVGELVELAGFDNIFSELPRPYSRVSVEKILGADPEYILILYPQVKQEQIISRKGWSNIRAVEKQNIITPEDINIDLLLRATPRSIEGAIALRKFIERR